MLTLTSNGRVALRPQQPCHERFDWASKAKHLNQKHKATERATTSLEGSQEGRQRTKAPFAGLRGGYEALYIFS